MSAAVAGTSPGPEIPATQTLRRHRRDPQNGLQGLDPEPRPRRFRPTASYTNARDVTLPDPHRHCRAVEQAHAIHNLSLTLEHLRVRPVAGTR